MTYLYQNFSQFIDNSLKGLKWIFYYIIRCIQIFQNEIYSYIVDEKKMDIEIVFASWCLTLFTTSIQTNSD